MPSLSEALQDQSKEPQIVQACVDHIDAEVAGKSGLSGMALKAGYNLVKGLKPGIMTSAMQKLLPEFAQVLDPIREEALSNGKTVPVYFREHASRIAEAMLSITDERIHDSDKPVVKNTYKKLRATAQKNVEEAVPGLADIIARFT
ncbi:MAG: hypothetical protein R3A47_00870 [Polyangiales bacterium]